MILLHAYWQCINLPRFSHFKEVSDCSSHREGLKKRATHLATYRKMLLRFDSAKTVERAAGAHPYHAEFGTLLWSVELLCWPTFLPKPVYLIQFSLISLLILLFQKKERKNKIKVE